MATAAAWWSSETPTCASVSNGGSNPGEVRGELQGTATISASWQGRTATAGLTGTGLVGSYTLSVRTSSLVGLRIDPGSPSVKLGTRVGCRVYGVLSDKTRYVFWEPASWTSSDPWVVSVSPDQGLLTPLQVGTATLTVVLPAQGLSATAVVTVVP